jgi:RNA polymerase sigma factor (sigma-70 family)
VVRWGRTKGRLGQREDRRLAPTLSGIDAWVAIEADAGAVTHVEGTPPARPFADRHGPHQRLPPELERELVIAAEAGDAAACARLVDAFLPAIAGVARLYRGSIGVDRSELLQEGVVGLLRAVKRYDPRQGTPFWSYASWWVRQAMQQLVAEVTRPAVLSDRALRQLARVNDARREHLQAQGREPSTAELAAMTGFTREQVESLIAFDRPPRGLKEALSGGDSAAATFEDVLPDPSAEAEFERVVERMEIERLRDLSEGLGERERDILFAHYGLGRPAQTLREIAGRLGLSIERVRQIEERALGKLRDAAASGALVSAHD